jgi:hypothetical protein
MKDHLSPVGKARAAPAAQPRLAFISSTIQSRPFPMSPAVPSQCPRAFAPASDRSCIP